MIFLLYVKLENAIELINSLVISNFDIYFPFFVGIILSFPPMYGVKTLGTFSVDIKLFEGVVGKVKIDVIAE